jgi:hypothetical protein
MSLKELVPGSHSEGHYEKSKVVEFHPGETRIKAAEYLADQKTPGSVFLIS